MSSKKELSQISASEAGRVGVTSLATRPNDASRYGQGGLSAKELQAWFDKLPNLVRERFNEIAKVLASSEAAKYIGLDGSVGGADNLYDFLSLFGARGSGVGDKNIGDYIETLYHSEDEANDKSYTLKDIIADVLARFALCEERRQAITDKLTVSAEYDAEGYVLSLVRKDGTVVKVSVEALADELYEAIREAKDELERGIAAVDGKLPVIRAEDEGKYLQIVNGHIVVGQDSYVRPRLYQPVITGIDSRGTSVTWEQNESNGAFETSRNRIYVDGKPVEVTDGDSFDFKEYVDGKITAMIGVSAIADGFLESRPAEGRWGLSNGDTVGIAYTPIYDGRAYEADIFKSGGELTVASYINGLSVVEASVSALAISKLVFLRGLSYIGNSKSADIGVMYLPSCELADGFNGTIDRLYSLDNLPEAIRNAVVDLSPNNNFRRINTWCTGVGGDGIFEWAYKPDGAVRVTCLIDTSDTYRGLFIPDVIDGMPVNGLGKFFVYNDGYVTSVAFGDNMRDINDSAMRNCTGLASIRFGKGLEMIGEHAFRYSAVAELDFSGCPVLREIKGRAFSNCSKLTKVTMPGSVKSIGSTAFASCSALKDIYVPWDEGEVAGAPWGATSATVHYNSEV